MRALFVPFAPSLAHVSRCLAVAEAWRARGHWATFAAGAERRALIEHAGFGFEELPEVSGQTFRDDRGLRWLTAEYAKTNLEAERRLIASTHPDVVVFDFRFTTAAAARLEGRPSASILHGNALRLATEPRQVARQLIGGGRPSLRGRVLALVFPAVFATVMRRVARRLEPLLAPGPRRLTTPMELLLGDEVLAADVPELLPPALPPRTSVVGPLRWSGWEAPAPWLEELDSRPLVYVTMGSTVEASRLLGALLEALREGPFQGIVTTGHLSPTALTPPSNVRLFSTVPGATVAARSALVVHHGGHETLIQALTAGAPSLMLPTNPDQVLVGQQARDLGVGQTLARDGSLPFDTRQLEALSPAALRDAIEQLIQDTAMRQRCQDFSRRLRQQPSAELAVDALERLAGSNRLGTSA